uniref:Potassium voltagegated channel protein eaglike [Apis florea] n=1 Tax=Lepeophtheirus salmonis TaxID=72036 RepID=A0A0K2TNG6_LEPSM
MPGGRRGLVAPQNTFLDNLITRFSNQPDTSFLLANAQIVDYPIVYCSSEFSKLLGFRRSEVMQKSIKCEFMTGALTDRETLKKMEMTFEGHLPGGFEVLYYKKNGHGVWLQVEITPIRNEQEIVVIFLCVFRDITAFKEPLEGNNVMSNLSKFAKLAWTMTLNRSNLISSSNANNNNNNAVSNTSNQFPPTFIRDKQSSFLCDSLPEYRHEPPKTPPHILLHYSPFKVVWDWVILGLTFYTVVMVPFNLAINRTATNDDITLLVADSIVDVIFFIDIIFNFHTSFVGHDGSVIVDEVKIRKNYLKSGFLIDVMACLPYDALNFFDKGSTSSTYGNIFSILKVMRLFRLGRVARALHRFLESSFALLLLMLSFYMIVAHWFACIWYVIGREDLKNGVQYGWLSALANKTGSHFVHRGNTNITALVIIEGGPPIMSMYLTALYFTMTCMTSIGFGNIAAETDNEKTFSCCMMIISSLLYAAIFGHVTTIIHNMTQATAKYHELLNSVKEFMILNEVPKNLCERVLDYVVSKWANTKGVDQNKVLSVCPKDMKADICVHLNRRVFNGCPAFRLASDGCLRALAISFEMIHSAPGDFIFRKGESIKELGFVVSGSLEVIQDGEILAFLGAGDVFGDSHWRENRVGKSAVHVRGLTYCDIHTINVQKLKEVLEFYKAFAQTFARNLTLTFDLSKRTVFYKVSDKKLERVLSEVQQYEPPLTQAQVMMLKRAISKFRGRVSEGGSICGDYTRTTTSPQLLRERLLQRLHQNRTAFESIDSDSHNPPEPPAPPSPSKRTTSRRNSSKFLEPIPSHNSISLYNDLDTESKVDHRINAVLADYKSELRQNLHALDEKIGRLENVIKNLTDSLPDMLREVQRRGATLSRTPRRSSDDEEEEEDLKSTNLSTKL